MLLSQFFYPLLKRVLYLPLILIQRVISIFCLYLGISVLLAQLVDLIVQVLQLDHLAHIIVRVYFIKLRLLVFLLVDVVLQLLLLSQNLLRKH